MRLTKYQQARLKEFEWDVYTTDDGEQNCAWISIAPEDGAIFGQVVEELGFGTSYFTHGKILTSVLYDNLPFYVSVDSSHLQLCSREFFVTILNDTEYELNISYL